MELKKILIIVLAALLVVLIACLIVKCVVPASDPETTLPQTTDEKVTDDGQGNAGNADNEDWELPIDIDDSFAQSQTTEPENTSDTPATGEDGEILTTGEVDEPTTTVPSGATGGNTDEPQVPATTKPTQSGSKPGTTTGGNTDEPQVPVTTKPAQSDPKPTEPPVTEEENMPATPTTTKNAWGQAIELPKIPG